jgi:adenylate cyclase
MNVKQTIRNLFQFSPLLVGVCWITLLLVLWRWQWLWIGNLELLSYNLRFDQRGHTLPDDRIVLIAMDDASILGESFTEDELQANPGLELLRNYPYPRKTYALILDKLLSAGARVVVFDLILSSEGTVGSESEKDNKFLTEALIKYRDKVVLGANFIPTPSGLDETINLPHADILPSKIVPDHEILGYVNYKQDGDGFIRRMHPTGWPFSSDDRLPYSLDALAVKKAYPKIQLPQKNATRFIVFSGPNETYPAIPLYLLFTKKSWAPERPPLFGGKVFKDKIVLVGPRAKIFHDEHLTPFGDGNPELMFGPDIHVHAISTLLNERNLRELNMNGSLLVIFTAGLLFTLALPIFKSPLGKLVPAVVLGGGYWWIAQICFQYFDLFIPLMPVVVLMVGSTASVVTGQAIIEQIEKRRISGMFQQYVSKNVAEELIKSGQDVNTIMVPQKRTVTLLFSDIRDFTSMTETSEPGPFVQQLNEYLTAMVECVFENNGTLDKFVGDAVVAVFGNPTSLGIESDAWQAVKTALKMRERLAELNAKWEREGRLIFRFGIGLNHGDVMAGDIGSKQKKEFGVIGDPVNIAARVESLNKEQKTDILITDSVYQLVKDRVEVEHRGDMHVKGRAKPVDIYALKSLKV